MKTIIELSKRLEDQRKSSRIPKSTLATRMGVSNKTVNGLLSGANDARLSTVMALAFELGLELTLVPKAVAMSVEAETSRPRVRSLVDDALDSSSNRFRGE